MRAGALGTAAVVTAAFLVGCSGRTPEPLCAWWRTELYFGHDRRGAAEVTDAEFSAFVETEVSPRFPEGLTVLPADGRYRAADGSQVRERTKVMVIVRPDSDQTDRRIEQVRDAYREQFDQEGVLRVDQCVTVRF